MAIVRYGTVTTDSATDVNTTRATSHTVEAGSDRLLVYIVGLEDGSAVPSQAPVFNGAAMTLAQSVVSGSTRTYLYYLVAPDAVTADISITFTNNCDDFCCIAANFSGVDQSAPLGNSASQADGTSPYDISLAVAAGSLLVGGCCVSSGAALPFTPAAGLTALGSTRNGTAGTNISLFGGYRVAETAGTHAAGCSAATSTTATLVAVEFRPAAAGTDAAAAPAGVAAQAEAGSPSATADLIVAAAGLAASGAGGSSTAMPIVLQSPAGVLGTMWSDGISARIGAIAAAGGLGAAGQAGGAIARFGARVTATGIAATGGAGSIEVGQQGALAATGTAAATVLGVVSVRSSLAVGVTGIGASGTPGLAAIAAAITQELSGVLAGSGVGWLLPRLDAIVTVVPALLLLESGRARVEGAGWSIGPRSAVAWTELPASGESWITPEKADRGWSPVPADTASWAPTARANGGWMP